MEIDISEIAPTLRRVFLVYPDLYLGKQLVRQYLSIGFEVDGLLYDSRSEVSGVSRTFCSLDIELLRKALLEADIIVVQLVDSIRDATSILQLLRATHYDGDKRVVLVSSVQSWAATPPSLEHSDRSTDRLTEDQYNRRVPHLKYAAWREVETLYSAPLKQEQLRSYTIFSGMMYGEGEDTLLPLLKHAWNLDPQGLPRFGTGEQITPMIHVRDLATFIVHLTTLVTERLPEQRYLFAVDDGECSWASVLDAVNKAVGSGVTHVVPPSMYCLYDNVEHFTVNLRVDADTIQSLLPEKAWWCRDGFVASIDRVVDEFKRRHGITALKIVICGPPLSGKTYASQALASSLKLQHLTIADIIADYGRQQEELREEMELLKKRAVEERKRNMLEEKREAQIKASAERLARSVEKRNESSAEAVLPSPSDEEDDLFGEMTFEMELTVEEQAACEEAALADESIDEQILVLEEKINEIGRVLQMRAKVSPIGEQASFTQKDKVKRTGGKPKTRTAPSEDDSAKDARLSDHALARMVRWKLQCPSCRNQGYILDGFPKTVRQARLVFAEESPEVDEVEDSEAWTEETPASDAFIPSHVFYCQATDSFLLDRLQLVSHEHRHNNPEDFQRRLDYHKQHFDAPNGVLQFLESAKSSSRTTAPPIVKTIAMSRCPLIPPPPLASRYASPPEDAAVAEMLRATGAPHNFGPTPQERLRECERRRLLEEEERCEAAAAAKEIRQQEEEEALKAAALHEQEEAHIASLRQQEQRLLEERKAPLKSYLMETVMPILTKGLLEVCQQRPDDPVNFLAEWLVRHDPEDSEQDY